MDYQSDSTSYDYNYENQDYVEEPQPSLIPQFTTEAQHFKVAKDRIIRLPCRVDHLGKWHYFTKYVCSISLPNKKYSVLFQSTMIITYRSTNSKIYPEQVIQKWCKKYLKVKLDVFFEICIKFNYLHRNSISKQ